MTFSRTAAQALIRHRLWAILAITLVLGIAFVPGYFSLNTLALGLDRVSTIGIVAVGMTVVLIAGRIDLSSGSIVAVCSILMIQLQPLVGPWPAILIAIAAGGSAGLINAFLIITVGMNSMIATLATMFAFRSLAHLMTDSLPITGDNWEFGAALTGDVFGMISSRVLIFVVLIVLLHVWLSRTPAGRSLYAVGSNTEAARDSGINATRYIAGALTFAGLCAGLSGVLLSLNVNTGSPVFGLTVVISAIVAVVMGGTRLEGGRGSALGTLGGVVTVGALTTALEYASVAVHIQQIVTGSILIVLILLDRLGSELRLPASPSVAKDGNTPSEMQRAPLTAARPRTAFPAPVNQTKE